MISLYSGTPGSGKSLHAVHEVQNWLRAGKRVICTFNCDTDLMFYKPVSRWLFNNFGLRKKRFKRDKRQNNFTYISNDFITPDYLYQYALKNHVEGVENQTTLIIDECVQLFSPTVIGNQPAKWNKWETFFRVHRHLGYNVILIPQSAKLLSRKVLEYCEYDVRHYNRKNQGVFGWLLSLFLHGFFSYHTYWRGIKGDSLDTGYFTYKPIYGKMYNSYVLFSDTLKPYQREWEQKKILLSKLCTELNYIKEVKKYDSC